MAAYDPSVIDPLCLPLVEYFNSRGLPTRMSCQGHNDTNMSMFWIEFDETVGEDAILDFQVHHPSDMMGNFASDGRFAKRLYVAMDKDGILRPFSSWHYFAATVAAAMEDLHKWQEMDGPSHT